MSDMIQVVRVDDLPKGDADAAMSIFWERLMAGDVIELTERMIGQGDPVWPAKFYISEPVPVDD